MSQLFLAVLDLSAKASILIIAVLLLRLLLKRAPRHMICLLWLLVGIRLVVPISVESALSLMPSAAPVSSRVEITVPYTETIQQQEIILPDTRPDTDPPVYSTPTYTPQQTPTMPTVTEPEPITPQPMPMSAEQIAAIVWLCGFAAFMFYLTLSYILLRRKVAESIPVDDGVHICPGLASPFVLGIICPRIYLSGGMDAVQADYVLRHERAHIARRDHWTKPLGFVILAVHWFNPLVWLAYILLCRDIELACDERVVKDMDLAARKGYSQALLACSVRSNPLAACPLAFGEVGVRQRIKSVLSYKKPAFWVIIASVLCLIAASVFFLTDPKEDSAPPDDELSQNVDGDDEPAPDTAPSPDPTPATTPQQDTDTQLIRREDLVTGKIITNETSEIIHFDDIASRAVEIVNSGKLIAYTADEAEHRNDGLTVAYNYSVFFFDENNELSLWLYEDALGYMIIFGEKSYYIEDAGLLKELELLMINAGQSVYLDWNDENEYALSNKLRIGMSYGQVKLVMGEPVSIIEETGTPDGLTAYCLNYRSTAKLHMLGEKGAAVEDCTLQFIQYYGSGVETARGISPGDSRSDVYDAYGRADTQIIDSGISYYFEPNDAGYSSVMSLHPGQVSIWDATPKAPYAMYFLFSGETLECIYVRPAEYTSWVPAMTSPDLSIPDGTAYDPEMYYPLEVPIGTSIAADLDGDGVDELIYQNFKSNGDVKLSINGIDMSDALEEFGVRIEWLNRECYYITDIERTDGKLEITVSEAYGGTHFFQYDGESLVYLGAIPNQMSNLRFDGDSYVLGSFRLRVLHTWYGGAAWRYADGELQFIEQDFYHSISGPGFDMITGQQLEHYYAICDFYVYPSKNLDRDPLVISEGTQFELLGTDNVEWVLLRTLDGEQYWLYCGNYSIATPNGDVDYPGHVIMGLSFAG